MNPCSCAEIDVADLTLSDLDIVTRNVVKKLTPLHTHQYCLMGVTAPVDMT